MDSEHVLDLASRSRVIVRVQAGDGLAKRYVLQRGQINRAGSRYCLVDISVSCEPFDELVQGDIDVRECAAIQRRLVFVNPRLDQCGSFALCTLLCALRAALLPHQRRWVGHFREQSGAHRSVSAWQQDTDRSDTRAARDAHGNSQDAFSDEAAALVVGQNREVCPRHGCRDRE